MGSTEQTQQQTGKTSQDPWKFAIPGLKNLIGQINGQMGNTGPTQNENNAFDQLTKNAQAGNPFTGDMMSFAKNLFSGGNGAVDKAYQDYQKRLSPYANGDNLGPNGNPMLKSYLDTNANDISGRVNGMFAAAGRDFSGANVNSLSRGITEGNAPILAGQYNTDVGRQFDAASSLYNGANTTQQLKTNMGMQGIGVGQQALQARDSGANQMLAIEAQRRGLPLQNIGNLSSLLTPLAQLGGKGTSSSYGSSTTTPPIGMQLVQAASALKAPGAGWGGGK
jgi:hypothetical protein